MAFKRVATEGATIDDREIPREWIEQMAANYDPEVYGARITLEHIKGVLPDSPFKAYGDVKALKAKENADGKLQLFADIDPTDELRALNKARQKIYSSIEVEPNFAKTGTAYLKGLAVTDNPASLGTEMLKFSASQGEASPLNSRKSSQTALFTAAVEIGDPETADHEFADTPGTSTGDKRPLSERIKAMFSRGEKAAEAGDDALREEVAQGMQLFANQHQSLAERVEALPDAEKLNNALERIEQIYNALDKTPDQPERTPATGGDRQQTVTDC